MDATKSTIADYPHLVKEWNQVKNGNLKPEDVSRGSSKKVWWKCYNGTWPNGDFADDHEWEAQPYNRTSNGTGCPVCNGKKVVPSVSLATTHPEIASQLHPTKNELTAHQLTSKSSRKMWWRCLEGRFPDGSVANDHEWEASVSDRHRFGCPFCKVPAQRVCLSNCLETTHPDIAKTWSNRNNFSPKEVVSGSHLMAFWKCPDCGEEWKSQIKSRCNNGRGCPFCCNRIVIPKHSLGKLHPDIAKQFCTERNNGITVFEISPGSSNLYWWSCNEGKWPDGTPAKDHIWKDSPNHRTTHGRGCPCCSGRKAVASNCVEVTQPELMEEWDDKRSPKNFTHGSNVEIKWRCKEKGHVWHSSIKGRTHGNGCPVCKESKGEKGIRKYLEENYHGKWKCQYRTKVGIPDFVIPKYKLIVEFNGEQHYFPVNFGSRRPNADKLNLMGNIERDHKKMSRYLSMQSQILIIPYWDKHRIPEILDDVLSGRTPTFSDPPKKVKKYELMRHKIRDRLGITEPEIICGLIKSKEFSCLFLKEKQP